MKNVVTLGEAGQFLEEWRDLFADKLQEQHPQARITVEPFRVVFLNRLHRLQICFRKECPSSLRVAFYSDWHLWVAGIMLVLCGCGILFQTLPYLAYFPYDNYPILYGADGGTPPPIACCYFFSPAYWFGVLVGLILVIGGTRCIRDYKAPVLYAQVTKIVQSTWESLRGEMSKKTAVSPDLDGYYVPQTIPSRQGEPATESTAQFCPSCGSRRGENARFCEFCGYKFDL